MKASLLIVEDHPVVLLAAEHWARNVGFEVRSARDRDAAIGALAGEPTDLAIVDLVMPPGTPDIPNGLEVIRAIRERWPATRIIACTAANDRPEFRDAAIEMGAADAVDKPLTVERLRAEFGRVANP